MDVKTDWAPTDFFNLADYNRLTGNLALACTLSGLAAPAFRALSVGAVLEQDDRRRIAQAYNRLSGLYTPEDKEIDPDFPFWFHADELNRIEAIGPLAQAAYNQGQRYGAGWMYGAGNRLGGGEFG